MASVLSVVSPLIELLLFIVTVAWVGRKPTAYKVTAMILIVAIVEIGIDSAIALANGTSIYGWYLQSLDASLEYYSQTFGYEQAEMFASVEQTIAGCWTALYLVQASLYVFVALFMVWVVNRLFKRKQQWGPFSQVDLSLWSVGILIAGIVVYAASNVPGIPYQHVVLLVSFNLLIVSVVPLSVQGAAASKGLMNNMGLAPAWQGGITVVLCILGVVELALPVIGLIDFWANLRKLPRGGEEAE